MAYQMENMASHLLYKGSLFVIPLFKSGWCKPELHCCVYHDLAMADKPPPPIFGNGVREGLQ